MATPQKEYKKMTSTNPTLHEYEVEYFSKRPGELPTLLEVSLEEALRDGIWGPFLSALRVAAEVQGGLGQLSKRLNGSRTTLYKTLSENGNPSIGTLCSILQELGYEFSIHPIKKIPPKATRVRQRKATGIKRKSKISRRVAATRGAA